MARVKKLTVSPSGLWHTICLHCNNRILYDGGATSCIKVQKVSVPHNQRDKSSLTSCFGTLDRKVQLLYSKDKARSENLAKKFLDEPVVGFDMEWPCFPGQNPPLQKRIGLIQVASEDTVALFHIGLHSGTTTDDIIAPSLRKLIESPKIAKMGVGILGADFARLRRFFGLKPQGAFELSHLDRLVRFAFVPHLLNTKMVSLANLVENHLGLPLAKGPVRTSNWSRPLNEEQKTYAASDAYAGFMLFHCMNAKRLALNPVPTLPIFAEQYPRKAKNAKGFAPIIALMLHPIEEGGSIIAANEFFSAHKEAVDEDEKLSKTADTMTASATSQDKKCKKRISPKAAQTPLTSESQALYAKLSARRKALAQASSVPFYLIANNSVLRGLAQTSPQTNEELLEVKGIGKVSVEKYGADWLDVITRHVAVHGAEEETSVPSTEPAKPPFERPKTPTLDSKRSSGKTQKSSDSSPKFGSPLDRTPALHTGLSFTFADTKLSGGGGTLGSSRPEPLLPNDVTRRRYEDIEILDLTGDEPRGLKLHASVGAVQVANLSSAVAAEGASRGSFRSPNSSESSKVFKTPPSQSPSYLKRKRTGKPSNTAVSVPLEPALDSEARTEWTSPRAVPLSPQSRIFRNKLVAFSKLISRKLGTRALSQSIVSEATLDLIVTVSPRTAEQLNRIAGIESFVRACRDVEVDLLRNIVKFAPPVPT